MAFNKTLSRTRNKTCLLFVGKINAIKMKSIEKLINKLNNYSPVQEEWGDLDKLIEEASDYTGEKIIKALPNVLERYPEHDGYGVFWSIVHTLEAMENYEIELVNSIERQPHEMSVLMLNRLINGGFKETGGAGSGLTFDMRCSCYKGESPRIIMSA